MVISLLILFCLSSTLFWFATMVQTWWMTLLSATMLLTFLFVIYYAKVSKVSLTKNMVVKQTPFGKKQLKYSEIQSFGAYQTSGNYGFNLTEDELNKKDFLSQKFVYVANRDNFKINSTKQKGSIRFHLVDDIYATLKQRLKKKNS